MNVINEPEAISAPSDTFAGSEEPFLNQDAALDDGDSSQDGFAGDTFSDDDSFI